MEPRRVFVTLELDTAAKLEDLRRAAYWGAILGVGSTCGAGKVIQATANVARSKLGGTHRGKKKP